MLTAEEITPTIDAVQRHFVGALPDEQVAASITLAATAVAGRRLPNDSGTSWLSVLPGMQLELRAYVACRAAIELRPTGPLVRRELRMRRILEGAAADYVVASTGRQRWHPVP